jgi:hypothetical protein
MVFSYPLFFFRTPDKWRFHLINPERLTAFVYLPMRLDRNKVHYYCGHLLASCTSPGRRMMLTLQQLVEGMTGRETAVLRGNLPQCRSVHYRWHMNPGRRGRNPVTTSLSYGTAMRPLSHNTHYMAQPACFLHTSDSPLPVIGAIMCIHTRTAWTLRK